MFQNIQIALMCLVVLTDMSGSPHSLCEACSSRTVPKPRPTTSMSSSPEDGDDASPPAMQQSTKRATSAMTTLMVSSSTTTTGTTTSSTTTTTTPRPNITFPTYKCPANYDAWYCLNDATCFLVRIGESVMYNCECAIGFMGPRCEYKELDGSYQPKRPRPILEKASIASGAMCVLLFAVFICLSLYLRYEQRLAGRGFIDDGYDVLDAAAVVGGAALVAGVGRLDEEEEDDHEEYCCCCNGTCGDDSGGLSATDTDLLVSPAVGGGGCHGKYRSPFMPIFDIRPSGKYSSSLSRSGKR